MNSLNDKINKKELKKSLYFLFSVFGRILDIVALKTDSARGQAFIVFHDIQDATNAMRSLNGFPMFEKSIVRMDAWRVMGLHMRVMGLLACVLACLLAGFLLNINLTLL